ncbi:MAG: hypothetical protein ACHBNF_08905 [Chromatiales bacterium]
MDLYDLFSPDGPPWLDSKPLYAQLAPRKSQATAASKYAEFVAQGAGVNLWDDHLEQQYSWVETSLSSACSGWQCGEQSAMGASPWRLRKADTYTQAMIATAFGVSSSTVSRVIKEMEREMGDVTRIL